ncbi:hypothetical protein GWI33_005836 [Rhynchophorus ferrugineus]|uniref:Uncharacterized protein n=1 Tax=Rhynchophorus ferrugineus TaxID=354439 RepID=A0A834IVG5_RHYFE|nr:hypothetical protein GWI33_005836 [Rhynchophorus ferrugineus]
MTPNLQMDERSPNGLNLKAKSGKTALIVGPLNLYPLLGAIAATPSAGSAEIAIAVIARCEIRLVIPFLNAKKLKPIEEVYGKACITVRHVRKWCREFSGRRTDVHGKGAGGHRCPTLTKLKRVI